MGLRRASPPDPPRPWARPPGARRSARVPRPAGERSGGPPASRCGHGRHSLLRQSRSGVHPAGAGEVVPSPEPLARSRLRLLARTQRGPSGPERVGVARRAWAAAAWTDEGRHGPSSADPLRSARGDAPPAHPRRTARTGPVASGRGPPPPRATRPRCPPPTTPPPSQGAGAAGGPAFHERGRSRSVRPSGPARRSERTGLSAQATGWSLVALRRRATGASGRACRVPRSWGGSSADRWRARAGPRPCSPR